MTKKKSHEEEIRRGVEELRRSGISVDDVSPALVAGLREQLGRGRETDLALVFLLGRVADNAAAEMLSVLGKGAADKDLQREIRRSLYKLAQKGIRPPASESAGKAVPRAVLGMAPEVEGYCSSVDGAGGRLIWIARPQAGSGIQLLQGMVSDRQGLAQAGGALIRRKELRRMAEDIRKNHGITMISVPWEYADRILYEGFEKAKAAGRTDLEQFPSLRAIFNPAKPKSFSHPIYGRLDAEATHAGAWRELSRRLLDEPEFRPWILDGDWMKSYLEQAEQAQESRLVLNQLQKEELSAAHGRHGPLSPGNPARGTGQAGLSGCRPPGEGRSGTAGYLLSHRLDAKEPGLLSRPDQAKGRRRNLSDRQAVILAALPAADVQGHQGVDLRRLDHLVDIDLLRPRTDSLSARADLDRRDPHFVVDVRVRPDAGP
ncbi:MAG: hypothetical protein HYV05_06800, partial [Deltaproteobacteria bacterium]|nr:hypothetical protein [Deltaproteobacteria bacterium]